MNKNVNNIDNISKDMNIMEIVQSHPETAEVMFKYGLHCLGCAAGRFESLEAGCKAHGMSDEDIDRMIGEMNKLIEKAEGKE